MLDIKQSPIYRVRGLSAAFAVLMAILITSPSSADDTEARSEPGPRDPYCEYWPAYCSPYNSKTDWERELEGAEISEDLIVGYQIALSPEDKAESSASANTDEYVVGHQVAQAAQDDAPDGGDVFTDADEAARQSANPLGGDFMVLLNQWNLDFQQGDITNKTRNSYTHIFQPVVPIGLGGDWILVTRPTLPII